MFIRTGAFVNAIELNVTVPAHKMRVYVSLPNSSFLRNLEPVIRQLAERGHHVVLGFGADEDKVGFKECLSGMIEAKQLQYASMPQRRDQFSIIAEWLKITLDYFFFLGPAFERFPYPRLRRGTEVPRLAHHLIRRHRLRYGWRRRAAMFWLRLVEEAIPADPEIVGHLRRYDPDVLLVSPLLGIDSEQFEHVRAAKKLRIPTVYAAHSWDNLSSKGLIRMRPEGIAVWNEVQKREALELHAQSRDRIWVTGAYNFDEWFAAKPSTDRETFLRLVGLPPDRAVILYLGSALFFPKVQREEAFVIEWVKRLRQSTNLRLRQAAVLVRPHPKRAEFSDIAIFGGDPAVVVWPPRGELPLGEGRQKAFFDSLYHADAVVALNTTAMIDAAIVGRSVHTILDKRYRLSQEKTFHFSYLSNSTTGVLRLAADWPTHWSQLAEALDRGPNDMAVNRFVRSFVRPHGLDQPSAPGLVNRMEVLVGTGKVVPLLGVLLRPIALTWLSYVERRAKIVEKKDVKARRRQKVGQWQERQVFLDEVRSSIESIR